jgi:hypothetical protein
LYRNTVESSSDDPWHPQSMNATIPLVRRFLFTGAN